MRTRPSRLLLALALLAASAPALAEVRVGGDLGISFTRNDQWGVQSNPFGEAQHTGTSLWWFHGRAYIEASVFSPGVLDLGASASYLGYRAVGGAESDAFNYQLRLNALTRTPVNISVGADRNTTNFTADTGNDRVGTTRTDSYGGVISLTTASYPYLAVTARNTTTSNRTTGEPEVNTEVTYLNAQASQSIEALNYTLSYDTSWSSGDFAETNYQDHNALLRAQAQLATNVTAQVSATYTLREPTLVDPLNPRIDNQSLATWVQFGNLGETSGGAGYTYADSLFEAPGSPVRQALLHAVSAYGSHRFNQDFVADLNLGASSAQNVVGGVVQEATSEGVGGGLSWTRQIREYTAQASASGTVGVLQPANGPNTTAWGVGFNSSVARPFGTWTGNLGLAGSYSENTGASAGDRTRLFASAGASGMPFGWTFSSLLTGGYSSSNTPAFGSIDQTNVRLDASATRGSYVVNLNAGLTDDLAEVLTPGAPPSTLLIPVSFNTQTRFITASGSIPTIPNLFLTLVARYLWISPPGRDDAWESALSATASYQYGAFSFSLYEQISVSGTNDARTGTQNVLYLSVSRSFGR